MVERRTNWIPFVGVTTAVELKKKKDEYDLNVTKIVLICVGRR